MVELFNKGETFATFRGHTERLINEINSFSNEKILGADIEKLTEYYFDEYKIQQITLFLDQKEQVLSETKIEQPNPWHRHDPYEKKAFSIDGFKITFKVPFDGDSNLLYLYASQRYLTRFPVDCVKDSSESYCGEIQYSMEFKKQELEANGTNDYVESTFAQNFKYYIETIEWINKDVEQFNESLPTTIKLALEARKKKADEYVAMGEKLSIPLNINPKVSNISPIHLKKVSKKKPQMPSNHHQEKECAIPTEDYNYIRHIIYTVGTSMEKNAKTYMKLDEEGLRDVILSSLNSHYEGTATGETFNKSGKTDIFIPFDNKSAFIAECKIWHGKKQLEEALEQLFSYTTWRDVRISLVIFNKSVKDFSKIFNVINAFIEKCNLCKQSKASNANEWHCKFVKSSDSNEILDVQLVVFDLFIEADI